MEDLLSERKVRKPGISQSTISILDWCRQSADCQISANGVPAQNLLDGFTLQNGFSTSEDYHTISKPAAGFGGAIYCEHSGVTIQNCIIRDSEAWYGGGIFMNQSDGVIKGCVVEK